LIANDDQRGKTEVLAAFYNLGNAVDGDQLVDEFVSLFPLAPAFALPASAATSFVSRHDLLLRN
jgi:hypothetical protein